MTASYRAKIEGGLTINQTISDQRLRDLKTRYRSSEDVMALIATVEAYRNAQDIADAEADDLRMKLADAEISLDHVSGHIVGWINKRFSADEAMKKIQTELFGEAK